MARRMAAGNRPARGQASTRPPCAVTPEEAALDEACFAAELRRAVEGALTTSETVLARSLPDWDERVGRICARHGR